MNVNSKLILSYPIKNLRTAKEKKDHEESSRLRFVRSGYIWYARLVASWLSRAARITFFLSEFSHKKHSRFTGQQEKGEAISLTPLYLSTPL